ncbi:MAG: cytochrome d ubiquinol oxidase subunit II [Proteobacteria bacterium]|nr:MAG: cytochrome d ubiquinol oxidase subunit II [Pseudomonadota bacterium]
MFESMSHADLQRYWWFLIAVLGGLLLMLTFVQGGQQLLFSLGRDPRRRALIVNALGRKWELTFTTLVTFGGALFAAFPLFYATSFGGAYWVWLAILLCFVIQAVAYEFRNKKGNVYGARTFELFLFINGSLGVVLLGAAVGTLFTGAPFVLDANNLAHWAGPARGLEAAVVPFNLALGVLWLFLARVLGALYILQDVDDAEVHERALKVVRRESPILALMVAVVLVGLMLLDGRAWDPDTGVVTLAPHKYLDNLLALPLVALVPLALGAAGLVFGVVRAWRDQASQRPAFWSAAVGTALVGVALFSLAGYNQTAFYPSTADPQSSLTIASASSSHFTLVVMSYVSLAIPFVVAYVAWVWRKMSGRPLTLDEIDNDPMAY